MTSHSNLSAASKAFGKIAVEQSNEAAAAMAIHLAITASEAYCAELEQRQAAAAQTVKTLQIERAVSGQFRYRIVSYFEDLAKTCLVNVDWQFGNWNKEETILQAEDRFLGNATYRIENTANEAFNQPLAIGDTLFLAGHGIMEGVTVGPENIDELSKTYAIDLMMPSEGSHACYRVRPIQPVNA